MPTYTGTLQDGQFIKQVPSPYTTTQITQWLSRIRFPTPYSEMEISDGAFPHTVAQLEVLARLHLVAFPFENTAMHYTKDHAMDVSYQGAFQRLVVDCKGSYCFGQNRVFMGMLRGLGYRVYAGSARVNDTEGAEHPNFTGISHMLIFVQPFKRSNQTYIVDVGFGSTGLVRPILLSDVEENVVMGTTPTEKHRLTRGTHPQSSLENAGASSSRTDFLWNLEVCHSKGAGTPETWRLLYSFDESECFPVDAESASFVVSMKPGSIFWHNILCIKYVLVDDIDDSDEDTKAQVDMELRDCSWDLASTFMLKYVMMGRHVKRNIGRSSVVIRTLRSDAERIRVLRELFGVYIPKDALVYIRGRAASLDERRH